jgi:hypothetical protein
MPEKEKMTIDLFGHVVVDVGTDGVEISTRGSRASYP